MEAPLPVPTTDPFPRLLTQRERAQVVDAITRHRLDTLLPRLMDELGIDLWLVICQEDNPDPLLWMLVPYREWQPILTILAFFRGPRGPERFNLGMIETRDLYQRPWAGREAEPAQWRLLTKLVEERDPQTIAINTGSVQWAAGGLTHNLHQQLLGALPPRYTARLTSAEPLVSRFAATLTEMEVPWMEHAVNVGKHVIAECYSAAVIEPGVTTTDDLKWHYLERIGGLGLEMSFTPYFHYMRGANKREKGVIQPGDLIHCDVGIKYLRYHTDHQQYVYVRRPGEVGAPAGYRRILEHANRLQDIYLSSFEAGLSGDALLARILARGRAAGLEPKIYSHSLGYFLHQPGPLIGLPWEQESNPGRGDVVLEPYQAFTMELSVTEPLEEAGGEPFSLSIEEDVVFTPDGARVLDTRQTELMVI